MLPLILAALVCEADRVQFLALYEENHAAMERAAMAILRDQQDAEDAMQNALCQIAKHFEKIYEIPCDRLPFWCVCIVKNESISILRRRHKVLPLEDWARIENPPGPEESVRPHFGGPVRPAAPALSGGPGDARSAGLQQQGDRPAALPDPDGGEHPHRPGPGAAEKIATGGGDTSMTDMTDQELDRLMRHVLMDGIGQEAEQTSLQDIPAFQPSPRYQRQMAAMQRDPLAWSRKKQRPAWKKWAQTAAALLLAAGLGLAASPTARADIVRLAVEWYNTHIIYHYAGPDLSGEMPQYTISALPDGYEEIIRDVGPELVSVVYADSDGDMIGLDYMYMSQGGNSLFVTEDDDVFDVTVRHMEGKLFVPREEGRMSTVTWIDTNSNIQFSVDAALDRDSILHIAESVVLCKTSN